LAKIRTQSGSVSVSSLTTDAPNIGEIKAVAWSPDGKLFASACSKKRIQILDIATGKVRIIFVFIRR
jgi:WD40 repeat protein